MRKRPLFAVVVFLFGAGCAPTRHDRADRSATAISTVAPGPSATPPPPPTTAKGLALAGTTVTLTEIATFESPTVVVARAGDDRLWVGQRDGRIFTLRGSEKALQLDLREATKSGGEQGLLGLAFNPTGNRLYVHFSDLAGDTSIDEVPLLGDGSLDPARRRHVLGQQQPRANHNGGAIAFGPDGFLYIGLGDGGSAGDPDRYAGNLTSLLGKLLRIDPRANGASPYSVPADNPYVGRAGARPEIYASGLRNPWRFAFDTPTGDLWIGDVGQGDREEIDRLSRGEAGIDFGWSGYEGTKRFNADVTPNSPRLPVYEYQHGDAALQGCSITGGAIYRGTGVPTLVGAYVFADYCVHGIRAIDPVHPDEAVSLTTTGSSISTFGVGNDGEFYVTSIDGPLYRIDRA